MTESTSQASELGPPIALMFSGGLDSSAAALSLAPKHRELHLLTYANGFGHFGQQRSRNRVLAIRAALGPAIGARVRHAVLSTRELMKRLVVDTAAQDFAAYRSGFIWCMGCKLGMHARSAAYCLEHGIATMADGSNAGTDEMVEQSLLSLSMVRAFYAGFGIDFITPVYDQTRDESRALLDEAGMRAGIKVLDRHLGVQPTCVAGELYYLPYLLFNKRVKHEDAVVGKFIRNKLPIARELVADLVP